MDLELAAYGAHQALVPYRSLRGARVPMAHACKVEHVPALFSQCSTSAALKLQQRRAHAASYFFLPCLSLTSSPA